MAVHLQQLKLGMEAVLMRSLVPEPTGMAIQRRLMAIVLCFPTSVDSDTTPSNDRVLNNDLTNLSVSGISVTGQYVDGDYDYYTLEGNPLTLTGNISVESGSLRIYATVVLGADVNISGTNYGVVSLGLNSDSSALIMNSFNINTSASLNIIGVITGSGNIIATNFLNVSGLSPDYTGSVQLNGVQTTLSIQCGTFGTNADISISSKASLQIQCSRDDTGVTVPISLNGRGFDENNPDSNDINTPSIYVGIYGTTDKTGNIAISKVTLNADATYGSGMSATDKVTINELVDNGHTLSRLPGSTGILVLNGNAVASSYEDIVIDEDYSGADSDRFVSGMQRYIIKSNYLYSFTVKKDGILAGTGTVRNVKIQSGGIVAPGLSPGTLTVANIEWVEGGIYEFEIGKDGADQIVANGTVTLGNGTLKVLRFEDYVPKANDVYTIIANDGSDAVTGTFKDLPEGATFTNSDGGVYKISYKGGDGNDVTLTVVSAPKVPNTGFAMLKNNPLLTLVVTTASAVAIAFVARKTVSKKSA